MALGFTIIPPRPCSRRKVNNSSLSGRYWLMPMRRRRLLPTSYSSILRKMGKAPGGGVSTAVPLPLPLPLLLSLPSLLR